MTLKEAEKMKTRQKKNPQIQETPGLMTASSIHAGSKD